MIYLPIEIKSRELDSRCLVALECLRLGKTIIIGNQGANPLNKPHVVLLNSAAGFELNRIRQIGKKNLVFVLDEEAIVHTSSNSEYAVRFSQSTINEVCKIFINGSNELKNITNYYDVSESKYVISGNPRFDFYKNRLKDFFKYEALKIKKK